jgi:hypothetical protein
MEREKISLKIKAQILHESGYQCSNPICRSLLTLDIHHIEKVSDGGGNSPENLIALCPNCHRRYHDGEITLDSIKAWKYLLMALNEAYDKKSINYLLLLNKSGPLFVRSEGLIEFASLIASGNVDFVEDQKRESIEIDLFASKTKPILVSGYSVLLSRKGKSFVENWINGKQIAFFE